MDWTPISEQELVALVNAAVALMDRPALALWNLIHIPPAKWQLSPWGDDGNGFWVVGVLGARVVWYNDIEDGFNVSRYEKYGVIADYWCNQDDLQHRVNALVSEGP
jgi:hypothetical protein